MKGEREVTLGECGGYFMGEEMAKGEREGERKVKLK